MSSRPKKDGLAMIQQNPDLSPDRRRCGWPEGPGHPQV
jgi:hypothetical protein